MLAPNSIYSFAQLEQRFHEYFYSGDSELRLSHLTAIRQKHNESVADYIRRFRDTRNRCFNLNLSDRDIADLAFNGLSSHLRDKLSNHDFINVSQVLQKALSCESKSKRFTRSNDKPRIDHPNINAIGCDTESSDDESADVCVAEWSWASNFKPFVCSSLKPASKSR